MEIDNMSNSIMIAEPGKQEIKITKIYDAPRELVFKIYTNAKLIPQWWGPKYLTTNVEKMELRPGGIWRFVQQDKGGNIHGFHGVYHDIVTNEKLVYTFEYEGMPGHVVLNTVIFEDLNDKTKITELAVFQSVDDRDGMLNSGIEAGVVETDIRFAELLLKTL
jgi:uncharacterized protein YndB with AHSA1/START domain